MKFYNFSRNGISHGQHSALNLKGFSRKYLPGADCNPVGAGLNAVEYITPPMQVTGATSMQVIFLALARFRAERPNAMAASSN